MYFVRWPTSATLFPIAYAKFQSLTRNSNRLREIQIAYAKFKSLTRNSNRLREIQITYAKFQFSREIQNLTRNSNCSREIQNLTRKFKCSRENISHIATGSFRTAPQINLTYCNTSCYVLYVCTWC